MSSGSQRRGQYLRSGQRRYALDDAQRALEDVEALRVPKAVICPGG